MGIQWFKNFVEKIKIVLNFNKVNSPSLKIKNEAQDVGTQVGQITIHQGLSYSEAKDLIVSVVDQKLIEFKDEAVATFDKRTDEFKKLLSEKIKDLPEQDMGKLREPDTQIALLEAAKISGRKPNEELRNLLANLVVSRIKNDKTGKEELKNIVYNEAISTVSKITIDQLKIITLCYLARYTSYGGIVSWDTFKNYLNTHIKPFIHFKNTNAEFQHIEYAGCGSIGIGSWNLVDIYRQQYSFLFSNLIERAKIEDIDLLEEIKNELLRLDITENKYFVRIKNKEELEKYLKNKNLEDTKISQFTSLYEQNIKNNDEVKKKLEEEREKEKTRSERLDKRAEKVANVSMIALLIIFTGFTIFSWLNI